MKTEKIEQEYERQLASLPPLIRLKIKQMEEREYAQELIIAWLLSQVQKIPGLPQDHAQRFLSRQANLIEEESDPDTSSELVLLIDELRALVADYDASQ
ncbi:hypothetical protein CZ787_13310 [Halomonas citrativorans]|uniref:Uncharacterized protein n=1 Tax=Halomonas citrativorans TaxID=2742612 RepID=A0A1R4I2M0_9GAMM|nr:hypothetical protein [Halomonas citrativorans]SJN14072.1 hypothetical protein CZ787_13310 [Halomonas citrativorans]